MNRQPTVSQFPADVTRVRPITSALFAIAAAVLAVPVQSAFANSAVSVTTDATDLSLSSSYSTSTLPGTTDDVVLNQSYATTTLGYSVNGGTLTVGTLNNLYTTAPLTIANTVAGSTSTLALSTAANSVSGNANDLLYVGAGANLTLGGGAGTLNVTTAAAGNINVAGSAVINSNISGAFGLTKTGSGSLTLNGTNTFAGPATLSSGQIYVNSMAALGNGATNLNGGFLLYQGTASETSSRPLNATAGSPRVFFLPTGATSLSLTGGVTAASGGALQTVTFTGFTTGTLRLEGGMRDNPNVAANKLAVYANPLGSGATYVFAGTSTYTGGTTIDGNSGTVAIASNTAFGSGTITFIGSGSGGVFRSADATNYTINNPIAIGSGVTIFGSETTGNLRFSNTAAATLTGFRILTVQNTTEFDTSFTGTGTLYKNGVGTMVLAGANNNTGGTSVNEGTLQIGNGGTTGSLAAAGAVSINGTLAFNRSNTITQGVDFGPVIANYTAVGTGYVSMIGSGRLVLNGANTYTGSTTVDNAAGVIEANAAASGPLLSGEGTDIRNGSVRFTYTPGNSPLAAIRDLLVSSYADNFQSGTLRSTTAVMGSRGLGYTDDGTAVTVKATLLGDSDLDGDVDFNDFLALQTSYNQTNTGFRQGNFNYDNVTDFNDFLLLQTNYGLSVSGDQIAVTAQQIAAMTAFASTIAVPEPAMISVLAFGAVGLFRRSRRTFTN